MKTYKMKKHHPLFFIQSVLSFLFAVFAMQLFITANVFGNETDYMALLAIKSQLIDDHPDGVLSSWNHSLHHCFWEGVTCGPKHNRVVVLNLNASGLAGTISPFIGNLSFLRKIDLTNNSLNGQIPLEIGRLFRIRQLYLDNNTLIGGIPANTSGCINLRELSVSYNNLEGELPVELEALSHLKWLVVHFNNFIGPIFNVIDKLVSLEVISCRSNAFMGSIPDNISRMRSLIFLGLGSNKLSGIIPPSISNLSSLQILDLDNNQLQGPIPMRLGALSNLQNLYLGSNKLLGTIPQSIFNLSALQGLYLSSNKLSGTIPPSIFNLSSLQNLVLPENQLQGSIPGDMSFTLPQLQTLYLQDNYLSGPFPSSIPNLTSLKVIELSFNNFAGNISNIHFGHLHNLQWLDLINNNFEGDINFISTFANCSKLEKLLFGGNYLTGIIPKVVANLSKLTVLDFRQNRLSGGIPKGIGKLINLRIISMHGNGFTGTIPREIGKLQKLESLYLYSNRLTGEIPYSLGNLSRLSKLYLNDNKLQGRIPPSLGNCANLLYLDLSSNKLSGYLPNDLFAKTTHFIELYLDHNYLEGSLPMEISTQINLLKFYVYKNNFSGEIPSVFSSLTELQYLDLANNFFHGQIPPSFASLRSLMYVDLSQNNLCCLIPEYFSTFPLIYYLNLSYNDFRGGVPTKGIFANTSVISVVGNTGLCGGVSELHLPLCFEGRGKNRRMSHAIKSVILPIICAFVGVLAMSTYLCLHLKGLSKKRKSSTSSDALVKEPFLKVSYDLLLKATDEFSPSNLLGSGTFGSVFKGILDGKTIAVKVLNLHQRGGCKSFMAECEALRSIRHRNLVGIITTCSSMDFKRNDFKALVYEFMSNGSLDRWLYEGGKLSLLQRLNIVIDVAHALNYLHSECENSVVHCDLKPSNILLDNDMVAHVADFGLAKVLTQPFHLNQSSSIGVRGTVGYVAPEYGLGCEMSPEADVYSYGILLLELVTRKKPTDNMFKVDFNLHMYAKTTIPDQVLQIVDSTLLSKDESEEEDNMRPITQETLQKREECLVTVVKTGVACSNQLPRNRMKISEAISELLKARNILLNPRCKRQKE